VPTPEDVDEAFDDILRQVTGESAVPTNKPPATTPSVVFGPSKIPNAIPTKPLTIKRKGHKKRSSLQGAFDVSDKENVSDGPSTVLRLPFARRKQRSGIDSAADERDKNIEDDYLLVEYDSDVIRAGQESPPNRPRKLSIMRRPKLRVLSGNHSGTGTFGPSSPGLGPLLTNVFKSNSKLANPTLLSRYDPDITRIQCKKLLIKLGARTVKYDKQSLGALHCTFSDTRFRVEVRELEVAAEDMYSLVLVHEKGSVEAFREIYRRMSKEWVLNSVCPSCIDF
jgi:serine/threonine-protein kinase HSL1, negative regulator of Swe1 kinase